eukprot:m.273027 g.273027  ORF g.273027 m.273027 type:complete len:227 (-) comp16114_c0_seq1:2824-3504(-)
MQICDQIRRTRGLHLCFGHTNRARSHRVLAGESSLDSTYPRKICAREKTISMDERHSADSLTNDESDSMAVDRIRVNLASDGIVSCNSLSEQESPSDYCDRPPSSLSSVATVSPVTLRVSGSASTASGVPVSGVPTVMDHDAAEQQPKTIERRRESLLNDAAEEAKRNAKVSGSLPGAPLRTACYRDPRRSRRDATAQSAQTSSKDCSPNRGRAEEDSNCQRAGVG